ENFVEMGMNRFFASSTARIPLNCNKKRVMSYHSEFIISLPSCTVAFNNKQQDKLPFTHISKKITNFVSILPKKCKIG
ncbi:MAG: hypothetical protein ACP5PS_10495, partial [Bacteroidales bacterium]